MKKRLLILSILIILVSPLGSRESHGASLTYPHIKYKDIENHWGEEAILDVSGLGYMRGTGNEIFKPDAQITYVELYILLIKIRGEESYVQTLEPDDWIESALKVAEQIGLIEDERPNPRDRVTRETAAYLLGKTLMMPPLLGEDIRMVKNFNDFSRIKAEKTPYIELVLQEGYMAGDTMNNFKPKHYITRAEMAQIISNGKSKLVYLRDIEEKQGQVVKDELGELTIYNVDTTNNVVKYKNGDGNAFPVYRDKKLYLSDILIVGDKLDYYIDGNGRPIYGKIKEEKKSQLEGTIEIIDHVNRQISLWDFNDKKHLFKLDKYINMDQLYYGQEVILNLEGGRVASLTTIEEEDPERDGYIIPGSKFRRGKVLFASPDTIEIQSDMGREKFQIDPFSTNFYKKGQVAELFQVKEGDRVLLNFDDIYSSTVSEIKIEDEEKHINGIIRGTIEMVDERNKEVLIKEPEEYSLGYWKSMGDKTKVKLGTGEIYQGSKKISLSNLNKIKGQEAYIAYENSYGSQSIAKMTIKTGPAMEYKDKLQDIDYGGERLVLNTNSFNFHGGTIVVKDNRLVDTLNLEKDQSLFIASDYRNGTRGASFISIEGTSPMDDRVDRSRLMVYKGKIEDILDYKILVGQDQGAIQELIFTDESLVYDSELKKSIPVKAFRDSRYIDLIDVKDVDLRDRLEKDFYKNKIAYIIGRENSGEKIALGINLVPTEKPAHGEKVNLEYNTKGKITNIDQGAKTIDLKKVENYNNLTGSWENGGDETIDLSKSLVLLNDKAISLDELYKIRKNTQGYLVREKKTSTGSTYILVVED